jgi:hypothetical protein
MDYKSYLLIYVVIGVPFWVGLVLAQLGVIPEWGAFASVFLIVPWGYVVRRWAIKEDAKGKEADRSGK